MTSIIRTHFNEHAKVVAALEDIVVDIAAAGQLCAEALAAGHRIYLCGNGGSASDAQHIAAELIGRFVGERRALPAIALNTDTSALTAIANDYGYDHVYVRQVEGLCQAGDVLIGISTSGQSANVNSAVVAAQALGCKTVALSGKGGGVLRGLVDAAVVVPSDVTARIQECHILIGHVLCDLIEQNLDLV
ncbi:D-sedoheptulose 7-phosphate isomerase [Flavobacteriaceae bacterium]|nr:D-sedoheptulose 7-phosphate isomerase [Flavobacteriaceae bacterium]